MKVAPFSLSNDASIKAHLHIAKRVFATVEADFHFGAEHVAQAVAKGATQRQAAEGVGKSAAWVNRLLRWRKANYRDETPFGPEAKSKRDRMRVQASKQATHPTASNATVKSAPTAAFTAIDTPATKINEARFEQSQEATINIAAPRLTSETTEHITTHRANLIETLNLLCACARPMMRSKLALIVEKRRAEMGLVWDQLILPGRHDVDPPAMPLATEETL